MGLGRSFTCTPPPPMRHLGSPRRSPPCSEVMKPPEVAWAPRGAVAVVAPPAPALAAAAVVVAAAAAFGDG